MKRTDLLALLIASAGSLNAFADDQPQPQVEAWQIPLNMDIGPDGFREPHLAAEAENIRAGNVDDVEYSRAITAEVDAAESYMPHVQAYCGCAYYIRYVYKYFSCHGKVTPATEFYFFGIANTAPRWVRVFHDILLRSPFSGDLYIVAPKRQWVRINDELGEQPNWVHRHFLLRPPHVAGVHRGITWVPHHLSVLN